MDVEKFFDGVNSLKFLAKKEVGQNFLIDPLACSKIVEELTLTEKDQCLEIGCGAGSLTYFLEKQPAKTEVIDIDEGLLLKVQNDFKNAANLEIHYGNAMDFDFSPYTKIIGNLPYYITSGIIEEVVLRGNNLTKAVFMVQKEAANRLLAKSGSEDTTPLTLFINHVCKIWKVFNVGRNSFAPIPHVDSSVLVFEIIPGKRTKEAINAYGMVKKLFLNKRKTILNNLKNSFKLDMPYEEVLKEAEIDPKERPQDISYAKFIKLCSLISNC